MALWSLFNGESPTTDVTEPLPYTLGLQFKTTVAGEVVSAKYWRPNVSASSGDSRIATLWNAETETILAQVTFVGDGATGQWHTQDFDTPIPLVPDTLYCITCYMPDNRWAFGGNNQLNTRRVDGPLVAHTEAECIAINGVGNGNYLQSTSTTTWPTGYHLARYGYMSIVFDDSPGPGDILLEGDDLDSVGAIQSGAVSAAYALQGADLDSVSAIQSGAVSAAYALQGQDLDSVGAIQSGGVSPPDEVIQLQGGDLDSVSAIQSGTINAAYALAGRDLDSIGAIQSGYVYATATLDGSDLDSVGAIQSGEVSETTGVGVGIYPLTIRVYNDVGFAESVSFDWEIQEELLSPQWDTVPDKSDRINVLPQNYDVSFYVSSNAGDLILWRLATSPTGFSINSSSGVVTGTASAGVGNHTLRVGVTNSLGEELSNLFNWEILEELLPPQWDTIPAKQDAYEDLPRTYNVSPYVSSNSGVLATWSLVSSPAGFSIDQSGEITAATQVASGTGHSLTVRVFNDEGGSNSAPFIWTIDPPINISYYHEFNADLGGFTHERGSSASFRYHDDVNAFDTVGVDVPVYADTTWNGSAWVPTGGWTGLRIEQEGTNYVRASNDFRQSSWLEGGATANTAEEWETTAGVNGNMYQPRSAFDNRLMLFSMDCKGSSGDTNMFWNWYPSQDSEITFPVVSETDYAYYTMYPNCGTDSRWTLGSNDADAGRRYSTKFAQAERDDNTHEPTSRILNTSNSSDATRAEAMITQTFSSMGLSNAVAASQHAGQCKLYLDASEVFPEQFLFTIDSSDSSDYSLLVSRENGGFTFYQRNAGAVTQFSHSHAYSIGDLVDFRWKVSPTQKLKVWVNGTLAGLTSGSLSSWTTDPTIFQVGGFGTPDDFPMMRVRAVRVVQGDVSDGDILAWA